MISRLTRIFSCRNYITPLKPLEIPQPYKESEAPLTDIQSSESSESSEEEIIYTSMIKHIQRQPRLARVLSSESNRRVQLSIYLTKTRKKKNTVNNQ